MKGNIQFLYSVLGTSLLWRSTVAFTYLKMKSTNCLCLHPVVLVLRIILVLFTSLNIIRLVPARGQMSCDMAHATEAVIDLTR